jgi:hypothetical protein
MSGVVISNWAKIPEGIVVGFQNFAGAPKSQKYEDSNQKEISTGCCTTISGCCTTICGCCTTISGCCTTITGCCTTLSGCCTTISGCCTTISGYCATLSGYCIIMVAAAPSRIAVKRHSRKQLFGRQASSIQTIFFVT